MPTTTAPDLAARPLRDLQAAIRSGDTRSVPLAGLTFWSVAVVLGLFLPPRAFGVTVLYGVALIFPLAIVIARIRGHNLFVGRDNPLTQLFFISILPIVAFYPIVMNGAAINPLTPVLYFAIGTGLIWAPWGWTADDPVGLRHAIGRTVACYAAYALVPAPYTGSAICVAVVVAYLYSLAAMRRD